MFINLLLAAAVVVPLLIPCNGLRCPAGSFQIYACTVKGDSLTNCKYIGTVTEETLCKGE